MSLTTDKLQLDLVAAMKGKDALKVSTIRMARSAIHNKEIDKRAPLDEQEVQAVLATMVKQRKDSFDQFVAGNRSDLAEKEAAEIDILKVYMPQEVTGAPLKGLVDTIVGATEQAIGRKPSIKEMGSVMKNCQAWLVANNARADGKALSTLVKEALA
jgi:uncharacterized protein YqeY